MKKLMILLVAVILMLGMVSSALAERINFSPLGVQCVTTDQFTFTRWSSGYKTSSYNRIYVYHTVAEGNYYTNYFQAQRDSYSPIYVGYKWCTPTLSVPIQGNGILPYYDYRLRARGNTDYNTYYGFSNLTLNGYFDIDQ